MKDRYFGAHEFQARDEVVKISSERSFGLAFAGFFALLLISNVILGPTCVCYIRTAVQTERLGSVTRIPAARRLLKRIRPLIEGVQGSLSQQEFALRTRGGSTAPHATETPAIVAAHPIEAPPVITPQNSSG